jgi:hypothetical protein
MVHVVVHLVILVSIIFKRKTHQFDYNKGPLCEISMNTCTNNPCHNNGLCLQTLTGYQCQCSNYYTGSLCDISLNPCDYSPCQNGGQCILTANVSFYCTCPAGIFIEKQN